MGIVGKEYCIGRPGRESNLSLVVETAWLVGDTGEYKKKKIEGVIKGKGERTRHIAKMVIKEVEDADLYIHSWEILKRAGIPTVPSMRKTGRHTVIMTDLTHDGSVLFGKSRYGIDVMGSTFSRSGKPVRADRTSAGLFLKVDLNAVIKEAGRVEQIAFENNILLPLDDPYELLVRSDGTWELLVVDLGLLVRGGGSKVAGEKNVDWLMKVLVSLQRAYWKKFGY